jgi:magnesium transporter
MMVFYALQHGKPVPIDSQIIGPDVLWVDLVNPTKEEEQALEAQIHLEVPTREEMAEIETSSRLYFDKHGLYLTADIASQADPSNPRIEPITFIVTPERLITVRYVQFRAFPTFLAGCDRQPLTDVNPWLPMTGLIEAIVDRTADSLERVGGDLDTLSQRVFRHSGQVRQPMPSQDLEAMLLQVGQAHDLVSKLRTSLVSFTRLVAFALQHRDMHAEAVVTRLIAVKEDLASLRDYDTVLSAKVDFLLDATMGLINIEQNGIIKIFSVMAVVLMPPTLVASVYGMNFRFMPELEWRHGYVYALGLMLAAAILPYLYFKIRKWL